MTSKQILADISAQQRAAFEQTRKDMAPYRDMGAKALSRLGELLNEAWFESQRTGIPLETGFDREWVIAALIRASSLRLLEFDTSKGLRVPMADGHVLYLALGYEDPGRESGAESSPEAADNGPLT